MDSTLKQSYTRRLSQCNKGEMIVIIYEITFTYLDEAKKAREINNHDAFKYAIQNGQDTINVLIRSLDFSYDISKELHPLYVYCRNQLAKARYQYSLDGINEAEKILRRLYAAFCEAAKTDTSGPLMRNVQHVYAGNTYGKTDLNESYINYDAQRGFLA